MNAQIRKYIISALLAIIVFPWLPVKAQTDMQYTQYYEIPSLYNPSAIGNVDGIRVRVGGRLQWLGIDNAPTGFLATADMPVKLLKKRLGVGLVAQQESAGLFRNMTVGVQAAYKQKLFKGELSAAIQIGFANEIFKGSKVELPDEDDYHEGQDEAIPTTDVSGNALDLGVGLMYTHRWFWAGVSCTHVNGPTITFEDDTRSNTTTGSSTKNYEFQLRRTLYFMAGSNIPIKNTLFEVMPSLLVKSDFTFTRVEVNGRLRYKNFLTAGVGYRYDESVNAMIGAEFKGFYIAYSYDYPLSAIAKASNGSHELLLGYTVKLNMSGKNNNKHKSIRIM